MSSWAPLSNSLSASIEGKGQVNNEYRFLGVPHPDNVPLTSGLSSLLYDVNDDPNRSSSSKHISFPSDQPSLSVGFGDIGASPVPRGIGASSGLIDAFSKKNHTGSVIRSHGRGEPTNTQGRVTVVGRIDTNLFKRRSATESGNTLAPIGDQKDFVIKEMELVYSTPNKQGMTRKGAANYTDLVVFACVNGAPKDTQLMFVGQNVNNIDPSAPHEMKECTITVAGTISVENNGWTTWYPGNVIAFSSRPHTCGSGKGMVPAVQMEGQPQTKFVPALFVLKESDTTTLVGIVEAEHIKARAAIDDSTMNGEPQSSRLQTTYRALVDATKMYFAKWGYTEITQPIEAFAMWNALGIALRACSWIDLMEEFVGNNRSAVQHAQDLVQEIMRAERYLWSPREPSNVLLEDVLTDCDSLIYKKSTEAPLSMRDAERVWREWLPMLIDHKKTESSLEQIKWLKAHVIGTVHEKTSPPGFPGDILLGFTHNGA